MAISRLAKEADEYAPFRTGPALVDDHKKILYKVCNLYCRNPDDRDDLAQEIVVQLWRSFAPFDGRCQFLPGCTASL